MDAFVLRPYAEVNLKQLSERENHDNKKKSGIKLAPGNIKIVHGTIMAVLDNGIDSIEMKDASVVVNNFKFNKTEHILKWDTLFVKIASLAYKKQGHFDGTSGFVTFNGHDLKLNSVAVNGKSGTLRFFSLQKLDLISLNTKGVVFDNELDAALLKITNPRVNLEFKSNEKRKSDTLFSLSKLVAKFEQKNDFKVGIKQLSVDKGLADITFNKQNTISGIHTNFSLTWSSVLFGHEGDAPLSKLKGFKLNLWDSYHFGNGLRTNIGKVTLSSDNGYLSIRNIDIVHHDSLLVGKWDIKDLSLKYISFKNFDYQGLFAEDRIGFDKLFMDGLSVDILQHNRRKKKERDQSVPFSIDLKNRLPLNLLFDTVEARNFHINYLLKDSMSLTRYGMRDFKFVFSPELIQTKQQLSSVQLLKKSALQVDSLFVSNELSGLNLVIKTCNLNPADSSLSVTGIDMAAGNPKAKLRNNHIVIDTVALTGISISDTMPVVFNSKQLRFSHAGINIQPKSQKSGRSVSDSTLKLAGLYRFSKIFNLFAVDTVIFSDIDINYYNADSSKKHLAVNDVKLLVSKVQVMPSLALEKLPVKFGNIFAELNNRKFVTDDSLYEMKAQRLSFDYLSKTFRIDSFYMTPFLDTTAFFERHVWQTQRVNLFLPDIVLSGFDLDSWNKTGNIHIQRITTDGMQADLYRDKNYPRDSLIRPLLQGMLRKVKQPFSIDSVITTHAYVRYCQLDEKSDKAGSLYLTDFNLTAVNLTNQTDNKGESLAKVFTNFRLMGTGLVDASFYFPLTEKQGSQFWFTLKSEKLDLTSFNSMTQNLAGLTILDGKGSIDIPLITANDTVALGSMLFRYHKLKVSLYNRKRAKSTGGISSPLINFILNDLVLRSNNPAWFKRPRVGIVYFMRNRNKSIVNFVWKSTFSGIMSTMGFNNKQQRKRRKEYRKQEFDVQRQAVKEEKYGKE